MKQPLTLNKAITINRKGVNSMRAGDMTKKDMTKKVSIESLLKRSRSSGSALVESFFILGVMVFFMIGLPILGKLIDLKQTTIQASRYAAWEKTVEADIDETTDVTKVDTRFFMDASAPISSSGAAGLGQNHLWGSLAADAANNNGANPNGAQGADTPPNGGTGSELQLYQKARVVVAEGSVTATVDPGGDNGILYGEVAEAIGDIGDIISPDGWDPGNPVRNGLILANVEAKVKSNALFSFADDGCGGAGEACVNEGTAILIDGWSAGDHGIIRERVHGFVPTNRLEKLGRFISKVKVLPMLNDLEHLEKAFGCVKTNIVPTTKDFAPYGDTTLMHYDAVSEAQDC